MIQLDNLVIYFCACVVGLIIFGLFNFLATVVGEKKDKIFNRIFTTGLRLFRDETLAKKRNGYPHLRYKQVVEDKIVERFRNEIIPKEIIIHILGKGGWRLKREHDKLYPNNKEPVIVRTDNTTNDDDDAPAVATGTTNIVAPATSPIMTTDRNTDTAASASAASTTTLSLLFAPAPVRVKQEDGVDEPPTVVSSSFGATART